MDKPLIFDEKRVKTDEFGVSRTRLDNINQSVAYDNYHDYSFNTNRIEQAILQLRKLQIGEGKVHIFMPMVDKMPLILCNEDETCMLIEPEEERKDE